MTNGRRLALVLGFMLASSASCGRSELNGGLTPAENVATGDGAASANSGSGGAQPGGTGSGSSGTAGRGSSGSAGGGAARGGTGSAGAAGNSGVGGATTGSGANSGDGGGTTGSGANSGAAGATTGVACGSQTCGSDETCCVQAVGGVRTEMCLAAGSVCLGGGTIGCTAGSCSGGLLCCLSLVAMATACATPAQCADGVSTVLCTKNGDCPADRRFCCPSIGINICRPYGCPQS